MVIAIFIGFALTESVGIAIGLGLKEAPGVVDPIILSLAGGTFIYIACTEIIVHEFEKKAYKWVKMLALLVGAAIIICLWFTHG